MKIATSVKIFRRGHNKHEISRAFDDTPEGVKFALKCLYRLFSFGLRWHATYEYDKDNDAVWIVIVYWHDDEQS